MMMKDVFLAIYYNAVRLSFQITPYFCLYCARYTSSVMIDCILDRRKLSPSTTTITTRQSCILTVYTYREHIGAHPPDARGAPPPKSGLAPRAEDQPGH